MRLCVLTLCFCVFAGAVHAKTRDLSTDAYSRITSSGANSVDALSLDAIETVPRLIDVEIDGAAFKLDALIVAPRDAKAGDNLPAIVISHGNPRNLKHQRTLRLYRYAHLAQEFARRGYVALVIARRGFAKSTGDYTEWYGQCDTADADGYERGGRTGAKDYAAALKFIAADPRTDPTRLLALGQSGGGFASLALASDPPAGLRGVINFAGGRGSNADNQNCNADGLAEAFHRFGTDKAVPSLWLYSDTDRFFSAKMVLRHFLGFKGPAKLVRFGPIVHAKDGHRLFQRGNTHLWRKPIDSFLRTIGMQTWKGRPKDPQTPDVPGPEGVGEKGAAAWREFLGSEMWRAFAVGEDGKYGWASAYPSAKAATDKAISVCEKESSGACSIYMLNEDRP